MAGRGSFIESFPLFGYDLRDGTEVAPAVRKELARLPADGGALPAAAS
jgi:hypothetical protein